MDKLKEIGHRICKGIATPEEEQYVKSLYQKAFGVPFSDCKCQLCDSVFKIIKKLSNMSTYKIKKGACLVLFGDPRILNSETITDEMAADFLKAKPEYARYFDYIPTPKYTQKTIEQPEAVELETPQAIKPQVYKKKRR